MGTKHKGYWNDYWISCLNNFPYIILFAPLLLHLYLFISQTMLNWCLTLSAQDLSVPLEQTPPTASEVLLRTGGFDESLADVSESQSAAPGSPSQITDQPHHTPHTPRCSAWGSSPHTRASACRHKHTQWRTPTAANIIPMCKESYVGRNS